jgi:hypothetical protein
MDNILNVFIATTEQLMFAQAVLIVIVAMSVIYIVLGLIHGVRLSRKMESDHKAWLKKQGIMMPGGSTDRSK